MTMVTVGESPGNHRRTGYAVPRQGNREVMRHGVGLLGESDEAASVGLVGLPQEDWSDHLKQSIRIASNRPVDSPQIEQ